MKGTTVKMALNCAMKVERGEFCTAEELRASLDTLAYAYNKVKPLPKRVYRKITKKQTKKWTGKAGAYLARVPTGKK